MTATTHECLYPLDRPILKDCDLVCADVRTMEGGIFLKLLEVWTHGRGHCMFGVANLDLCEHLSIDPVNGGSWVPYRNSPVPENHVCSHV